MPRNLNAYVRALAQAGDKNRAKGMMHPYYSGEADAMV
jgi:hypothetical protein